MLVYLTGGGKIPKHWEVRRLKYLVKRIIGGGTPDTSNLQYWANNENEGYLWVSIEDITNADFITDTKRYINQSGLANSSAKLLPPFSILYSIYASLGKIAYSNKILATNQAILGIQPNELLFYKFLFYYLQNTTNHIISFSNTTTQNNISLFIVANHKIPLPPLQEQKEIAEFLDKKCEKIANFITHKQKLITLLQEKKQALINETVTKGLNQKAKFKASGIDYLGTIPKHWEVTNLKNIVSIKSGGTPSRDNKDYWNGDIPWIRSEFCHNQHIFQCDVKEKITTLGLQKSSAKMCEKNTILTALVGATIGQVAFLNFKSAINQNIAAIYPNNAAILDNVFLFFVALTFKQRFEILGKYAIANLAFIGNLKIPLPPLQEQKEIAKFLDAKIAQIDLAIEKTKKQITLMKEYKNTIINEAVCGRIKLNKRK